jgi:signal transduction histidine kinase
MSGVFKHHLNMERLKMLTDNRFENTSVKIYIFDDGIGCKTIKKGFGLTGMESRVKELNGSVEFGSDGEKGFNIFVDIPLGG